VRKTNLYSAYIVSYVSSEIDRSWAWDGMCLPIRPILGVFITWRMRRDKNLWPQQLAETVGDEWHQPVIGRLRRPWAWPDTPSTSC